MMTSNDGGEDNITYSEIFNYIVHDQFPGAYCRKSKHQLKCFQEGCINQFPCQTVKRGCKVKNRKRIDIFCKCRTQEGGKMIQCADCKEWYHEECMQVPILAWTRDFFNIGTVNFVLR